MFDLAWHMAWHHSCCQQSLTVITLQLLSAVVNGVCVTVGTPVSCLLHIKYTLTYCIVSYHHPSCWGCRSWTEGGQLLFTVQQSFLLISFTDPDFKSVSKFRNSIAPCAVKQLIAACAECVELCSVCENVHRCDVVNF